MLHFWTSRARSPIGLMMSGRLSRASHNNFISILQATGASSPFESSSLASNAPSGRKGVEAFRKGLEPGKLSQPSPRRRLYLLRPWDFSVQETWDTNSSLGKKNLNLSQQLQTETKLEKQMCFAFQHSIPDNKNY
jgi:hypothetical protein